MSTYLRPNDLEKALKTNKLEEEVFNKVKSKQKYKYKDYRLVTRISRIKRKGLKDNYNNTLLISIVFLTLIRKLLAT